LYPVAAPADEPRLAGPATATCPNMHLDYYPQPDDPVYNPARAVGNSLAALALLLLTPPETTAEAPQQIFSTR
jgi:hypothetical protein